MYYDINNKIALKLLNAIKSNHNDIVDALSDYVTPDAIMKLIQYSQKNPNVFNYIKQRSDILDILIVYTTTYRILHWSVFVDYILSLDQIPDELMYNIGSEIGIDNAYNNALIFIIRKFKMKRYIYEQLNNRLPREYSYMREYEEIWKKHLVDD